MAIATKGYSGWSFREIAIALLQGAWLGAKTQSKPAYFDDAVKLLEAILFE